MGQLRKYKTAKPKKAVKAKPGPKSPARPQE